jgi:hypothetical protein
VLRIEPESKKNQHFPAFSVKTEKGILKSSDLKGKVVLVNFLQHGVVLVCRNFPIYRMKYGKSIKTIKSFLYWS